MPEVIVCVLSQTAGTPPGVPPDVPVLRVANLREAIAAASARSPRCDLALLDGSSEPPAGWLERLSEAAHADSTIASATALRGAVASPLALHPRIAQAHPHCSLLRREALDLVSDVEDLGSFSANAATLGLGALLVDDLLAIGEPWPAPELVLDPGPLGRSLSAVRRASGAPISVTIDARSLGGGRVGGTQSYTLQLIRALAGEARVRVLVAEACDASELEGVEVICYEQAIAGVSRSEVVHRPQQLFTADDLALLRLVGERIVVTHQDLIAYRTAAYHESFDAWQRYRRATRFGLAGADRVIFFSEAARRECLQEELVSAVRADVVGACVNAPGGGAGAAEALAPQGVAEPYVLQIGADYAHKNRPFAVALERELRALGWPGRVVFAGPHVTHGGSAPVNGDLGSVEAAQRTWLYQHASALLYPSTYEGFGLVPYEAAQLGLPCLFAPVSSLEALAGAAVLEPWDPHASAPRALELLAPGEARERHVAALRQATGRWSWEHVAASLLESYELAMRSPQRASAPRVQEELVRERLLGEYESLIDTLQAERARLSANAADLQQRVSFGMSLIDADAALLSPAQQRGLMRAAKRVPPLLAPFSLLGRIGRRGDRSV